MELPTEPRRWWKKLVGKHEEGNKQKVVENSWSSPYWEGDTCGTIILDKKSGVSHEVELVNLLIPTEPRCGEHLKCFISTLKQRPRSIHYLSKVNWGSHWLTSHYNSSTSRSNISSNNDGNSTFYVVTMHITSITTSGSVQSNLRMLQYFYAGRTSSCPQQWYFLSALHGCEEALDVCKCCCWQWKPLTINHNYCLLLLASTWSLFLPILALSVQFDVYPYTQNLVTPIDLWINWSFSVRAGQVMVTCPRTGDTLD